MDLTHEQLALLQRLRWRRLVFSGQETDAQRLAILQLYTARLVDQARNRKKSAMEWRITGVGRATLRSLKPQRQRSRWLPRGFSQIGGGAFVGGAGAGG